MEFIENIRAPKWYIQFFGDSHTMEFKTSVRADQKHPCVVERLLRGLGASVRARNFAIGGRTSSNVFYEQILSGQATQFTVPKLASIYVGENDWGFKTTIASVSSTTVFTVQSGFGRYYSPGANIIVGSTNCKVLSLSTDTITLTSAITLPTVGQAVINNTRQNIYDMVIYLNSLGTTMFNITGAHYLNFPSAGDTVSVKSARTTYMITEQQAAVALISAAIGSDKVVYSNTWDFMAAAITNGTVIQGSLSWHLPNVDVHLNVVGQGTYLAPPIVTAIQSKGWITQLS